MPTALRITFTPNSSLFITDYLLLGVGGMITAVSLLALREALPYAFF